MLLTIQCSVACISLAAPVILGFRLWQVFKWPQNIAHVKGHDIGGMWAARATVMSCLKVVTNATIAQSRK